jgi:hypothetical protein
MFPSHATMYWGLVSDEEDRLAKQAEYLQSTQEWHRYVVINSMSTNSIHYGHVIDSTCY